MKRIHLPVLTLVTTLASFAQTNTLPSSGNVGIGITNPWRKLQVSDPTTDPAYSNESVVVDQPFALTATDIDYLKAVDIQKFGYNIPAGVTSQGYQIGLASQVFVSDPNFRGTIDRQWAIWTRTGAHIVGTNGPRKINEAIGLYVEGLTNSETTIDNHYGIFQTGAGTKNYFGGNVGIGTTIPVAKLDVLGEVWSTEAFRCTRPALGLNNALGTDGTGGLVGTLSNHHLALWTNGANRVQITTIGNVGIGITEPTHKLDVNGNIRTWGAYYLPYATDAAPYGMKSVSALSSPASAGTALFANSGYPSDVSLGGLNGSGTYFPHLTIVTGNQTNSGNVGIGTTNPAHKLAVNGTIKAREVIVETTDWSDYVFADDYTLQPLSEVEAHIKTNKHLPGIPSAAQVAEQGVSVGDMQARLLAKIEELTLHQIAQEKELAALRTEVRALRDNQR